MNTKSKFYLGAVLLSLTAMLLVACSSDSGGSGGSDGDKVELSMTAWGNPAEIDVYQRAIDAYEEENPDVTVNLSPTPSDTYKQQLLTQLQGSQAPDVFYVGAEYIAQLINTGTIAGLGDFMESDESYAAPDDFADGLWGSARKDGEIYGIPVDNNPMLIYYNKNVLEESGIDPNEPQKLYEQGEWNWENFQKLNEQLTANDKYGFVVDNSVNNFFSWVWTNDGRMYDDDSNILIDDKAQEAFHYLYDNVQAGNFTYGGSLPEGQGADAMFMSNQTGFVGAGRWLTPMFSENDSLAFDYIPWPTNNGEQISPAAIATAYISTTAENEHLEEAMKFITFYTSTEGQEARLSGNGNAVPSIQGVDHIIEEAEIPEHSSYLVDAREIGIVEAHQSQVPGLDQEVADILDLMFIGDLSADEAITDLLETIQPLIDDYRSE